MDDGVGIDCGSDWWAWEEGKWEKLGQLQQNKNKHFLRINSEVLIYRMIITVNSIVLCALNLLKKEILSALTTYTQMVTMR